MVVLGLDAAWTNHHASGVAVVTGEYGDWRCAAATSSYEALFALAGRSGLCEAVEEIAGAPITLASVDMPLASEPIVARRTCDTLVSRAFGARGCAVHSPSADRPGVQSTALMETLCSAGFELTVHGSLRRDRQVIEVYPHIAVMRLLNESYRVPYKIARARQYWPNENPDGRRQLIRANLARILHALQQRISDIRIVLPPPNAGPAELKRFEDALDGIVCAWIGTRYLEGKCEAYGDGNAAIWAPVESA